MTDQNIRQEEVFFFEKKKQKTFGRRCVTTTALAMLSACSVGPHYSRPAPTPAPVPEAFKELSGWKPADATVLPDSGQWWTLYNDPLLNALEARVAISNQTLAADAANYREAQALVTEARAGLFPTLSGSFDATRSAGGGGASSAYGSSGSTARTTLTPELSASWTADIWGSIRHQVTEAKQNAQASKADLAYATLSTQATLASDYFELRSADSLFQLLTQTVAADQRSLTIARNQYNAGTVTSADLVTAEAQVDSAKAQLAAVAATRAPYEHAIAVLTGQSPADVTIPAGQLSLTVPVVPTGVPSELVERRPDIAAAEHTMHAQNEAVGVAVAALYPTITLSASGGFSGNALNNLFNAANRIWSLGGTSALTIFDSGAQGAAVDAARANYDAAVANYRETVLTAFQGVEDQLASLHALQNELALDNDAVVAAQKAVDVTLNQYRAGTVAYTSVVTEQLQLLAAQQSQLTAEANSLVASVDLIEDLGGGWNQ